MYDILRLYVYHDGVRVGMAESADSLQWMPAFDDLGEFKLVCAATETNRALLVLDAVLYNPDTPGLAAVVLAAEADGDNHRMTVQPHNVINRRVECHCVDHCSVSFTSVSCLHFGSGQRFVRIAPL